MAQTKKQIEAILSAAGTQPKHRFGQNFMIDQNLLRLIADTAEVCAGDRVIEIGPGTGTLTEELLARGARVLAVEIDRDLARSLRDRFSGETRFELIEGDALDGKHALNPEIVRTIERSRQADPAGRVKLVANLPYSIASPLIVELLLAGCGLLVFTVQKEVAERLEASAGDDAYGPLSVVVQLLGKVEVLRKLPPQAFWPAPSIDSALVRVTQDRGLSATDVHPCDVTTGLRQTERTHGLTPVAQDMQRALGKFIHAVFSYRRKTLRKALTEAGYDAERVIDKARIDGRLRPEALTPAQFAAMFEVVRGGSPSEAAPPPP